ncbi:glutamate 5-kinase [Puccinia triticina 1-1 BBBD Race 1]|uniref:Glutamate 5-kinase n=1 Tax=Puccinia triticina (isolate 1-1 / race 1 (BBBD)) TaxID=630390 RepID=A0A0C4ES42_PUCT1|nr:glutamate 5-kinase [Puccinia triticina 1-1 BBBD Race 1]
MNKSPPGASSKDGITPVGGSTIVIKLGTSSILSEQNLQPRLGLLANLVETCVDLRAIGHKVVLVSSGAIGMGMRRMSLLDGGLEGRWGKKPKSLNEKQALAAIGQGHLIALWDSLFSRLNQPIAQILLTRGDLADRSRYLNASSTLSTLLNSGVIPIINENDTISVSEIKFGDNDTLSAVTAAMCHADFLFLMTDVDCLFTANPRSNPSAQMVKVVYDIERVRKMVSTSTLGSSLGTGGMETKLIAAELATAAGVATIICNGTKPQSIAAVISELQSKPISSPESTPALLVPPRVEDGVHSELIYTVFLPRPTPLTSRKFWVAHGLAPRGKVVIDRGAYEAISDDANGGRLLPAGLVRVCGTFAVAQAVSILVPKSFLIQPSAQGSSSDQEQPSAKLASLPIPTSSSPPANETSDELIEVGRGLVNYNSSDMNKLKGLHSSEIESALGHIDSEHVIESIVLFKPSSPAHSSTNHNPKET